MRCTKLTARGLVSGVTHNMSTRRLVTDSKRSNSSPSKPQSPQPVPSRFLPAQPGTRVVIPARPQPQTPAPPRKTPQQEEKNHPAIAEQAPSLHELDIHAEPAGLGLVRFAFPRGSCPKRAWWDRHKPDGTKPSELRWTAGRMYPRFWRRCGVALFFSAYGSSLLGGAGVLSVVAHTDGPVATSVCLSVFAALSLTSFTYGMLRSRTPQEAWMGLVSSRWPRSGPSMMPYIQETAQWEYSVLFRPMNVKLGDIIVFR